MLQPQPAISRSFIVAIRFAWLLAAACAGIVALRIALRDGPSELADAHYGCPMHPEVRSKSAGQCPICGMALELDADSSNLGAKSRGSMPGMADLTAVENVRKHKVLDFVRWHALPIEVRELRGAAWIEPDSKISAVFYQDQAAVISADDTATFTPTQAPETHFAVQLMAEPKADWDSSCTRLRFQLKASAGGKQAITPVPGRVGWLEVQRKPRTVLTVPESAILQSPEGPYVLRSTGGFSFEKRPIQIGETFSKQSIAVVLSGLAPQDRVVGRASFFLDADRRLQSGASERDWEAP
jgi:hypothetical protein